MGFDWGSFCGGAIGTLGAYWAAWYTLKKQREQEVPKVNKMRFSVAASIRSMLNEFSWQLLLFESNDRMDVIKVVLDHIGQLAKLLPDAIEVDSRLVEIIVSTRDELMTRSKSWMSSRDELNLGNYLDEINNILESQIKKCDSIMSEVLKHS